MRNTILPITLAPLEWLRGPVRHEGGWLVLDRLRAEAYELQGTLEMARELAAIGTTKDMDAFVMKYGLLTQAPRVAPQAHAYEESIVMWEQEVSHVRSYINVVGALGKVQEGDQRGYRDLRIFDKAISEVLGEWPAEDQKLIEGASRLLQTLVAEQVGQLGFDVAMTMPTEVRAPAAVPRFYFATTPYTLLDSIWFQLALLLVAGSSVDYCIGCGKAFFRTHPLQTYCTPQCSQRTRYKRHIGNKRQAKR